MPHLFLKPLRHIMERSEVAPELARQVSKDPEEAKPPRNEVMNQPHFANSNGGISGCRFPPVQLPARLFHSCRQIEL